MTTRQALGRHRATPVRTNPLESISKAVASNAGSVGRQAAVIAAASGLVLTLGVPAQGDVSREASAVPVEGLSAERVAVKAVSVSASKAKDLNIERAAFTSKPAPAPVVIAVANEVSTRSNNTAPETRSSNSSDAFAPVTRSNRDSAPAASAPKPKSESMNTANLSGIAATAAKYVGVPYVWGGNTPSGWDCSGFVKYVYAQHGINIARGTSAIRASGQFVRTSSPKPGDLVFQNGGGHVGIYLGGGKMIGAQNPTVDTMLHDVSRNPLYGYYTLKG
ncbi:C40 family peptidase [Paeniglutamicibacter sp. ABSL32-1]|uniref:C40 family peptidase n=1 Tax=Paeniglutamicibacter quisquiliarum TaxID=2849498 RepID=UPI001C2DD5F0|nr:C40 family peptidase [Paeniglutamicibacter quisquiliarum]